MTGVQGNIAGESFYNDLIFNEQERIALLKQEYMELTEAMNEAMASGAVTAGSEAWSSMKAEIDSVSEAISSANLQIEKYEESIREIAKLKFDDLEKQFGNVTDLITSNISSLEKQISIVEESGAIAGESFYAALIESGRANLEALEQKHKSLSDSMKEALDNGSIQEYDDTWFEMTGSINSVEEAILDARLALIKYEESMKQVAMLKFDSIAEQFSNVEGYVSSGASIIEKQVSLLEASGKIAGKSFYQGLIDSTENSVSLLEKEYNSLSDALQEAVANGDVTEYSEEWFKMQEQIDGVKEKWLDAESALVKYKEQLKDVAKIRFDAVGDAFNGVTDLISGDISIIEKQIAFIEESGKTAGESYYRAIIEYSGKNTDVLRQKYDEMSAELQKGLDSGDITMYDSRYMEMTKELSSLKAEIIESETATERYKNKLKEVAQIRFDSLESQFNNTTGLITNGISRIEKEISAVESAGGIAGESYYRELEKMQEKNIHALEQEAAELTAILNEALSSGQVEEYSEEWYKMVNAINSVENAIFDAEQEMLKYGESIKEIAKLRFDNLDRQFSNAVSLASSDIDYLEKQIARVEATGATAGESFYQSLIDSGNEKLEALRKQYDSLYVSLDDVEKYSDNWYDMVETLRRIRSEIIDTETETIKWGNSLKEVSAVRMDSIESQFEGVLGVLDAQMQEIELKKSIAQESGYIAGQSFNEALISVGVQKLDYLEKEYKALIAVMNEALDNGTMVKGDAQWLESVKRLRAVRNAYLQAKLANVKYQNEIRNSTSGNEKDTRDIAKEKFESLEKQFNGAVKIITSAIGQMEKKISFVEEAGYVAGESFYNDLIEAEKTHIGALTKEYETLYAQLGTVEKYSDNWYDMVSSIESVKDSLIDAETALVKYGNALKELEWGMFDRKLENIGDLSGESDFIMDLMGSNRKITDEDGAMNNRGLAMQGLHAVNYDIYMRQAQEYGDAIKKINKEIAEDPGNTKLLDRYKELLKLQREAVMNAEDEKTAVKDLVSDGYDALISRLDELIDTRKKALKAASDLHDYEKTVSEQTADVDRMQKILLSYQGDDSEGMKSVIQKAKDDLLKAQEALNETEYDRYMADQEAMMDTFSNGLEEWVNIRLDDINGLLESAVNATNANGQAIRDQISADLSSVGMSMTENFSHIFDLDYSGGVRDIVSGFCAGDGSFASAMTMVSAAIDNVIAETDRVKVSSDMIGAILDQRFPELAASIPSLEPVNLKIGNVNEAVNLTKDAVDSVRVRIADLDDHTTPSLGSIDTGIDDLGEDLFDLDGLLDEVKDDVEQADKNNDDNLGKVKDAVNAVSDNVSGTGPIVENLDKIDGALGAVKNSVVDEGGKLISEIGKVDGAVNATKQKLEDIRKENGDNTLAVTKEIQEFEKVIKNSPGPDVVQSIGIVNTSINQVHNLLSIISSSVEQLSNIESAPPGIIGTDYLSEGNSSSYNVSHISDYNGSGGGSGNSEGSGNTQSQPKNKNVTNLNIETSIIDRCKYFGLDSSPSGRKALYNSYGGSDEYIGSESQNVWLINQMKAHGYKNGVHNLQKDEIAVTQEDGTEAILTPYYGGVLTPLHKGDSVLTAEQTENLYRISLLDADELRDRFFSVYMPKNDVSSMMPNRQNVNNNNVTTQNDIDVSFTIPNVKSSDDMARFLQSRRAEQIITSIVESKMMGKNSLNKFKY